MQQDNILVISNNCLSNTESNGRILSLLFSGYDDASLYNYCIGGVPDKKDVYYIRMNDKKNIKSLLSFGYIKPELDCYVSSNGSLSTSNHINHKKAFHYFIRNILYSMNFHIIRYMKRYIRDNNIKSIFLFGADAPYMYRLSRLLSKRCNIPLEIYTCEDYPLKDYNYIEGGRHNKNIFFKLLMRSLKKQARNAYKVATSSTFNSEPLLEDYKKVYKLNNPSVRYLPSILTKVDYKPRDIRHIVYGGNLYSDRVNSLLDISEALLIVNKDVVIDIYGKASEEDISRLNARSNINYHGLVDYVKMIEIYKSADMLLHVDGFSSYSLLDYKHAFSTKISDCYMLGIPFFIYSPIDIASTEYAYSMNKDYTAISRDKLGVKLNNIINNHLPYKVDYQIIKRDFGIKKPL